MWFVLLIVVVVLLWIYTGKGKKKKSYTQTTSNYSSGAERGGITPVRDISLNPADVYDICCALSYMVGSAAIRDEEDGLGALIISVDSEKKETSVYAHAGYWVSNYRNAYEYYKLGVSESVANMLTKVPFEVGDNGSLKVVFKNKMAGTIAVKENIEKGLNYLPYRPRDCRVKSYPIKGNEAVTCIELFISKD